MIYGQEEEKRDEEARVKSPCTRRREQLSLGESGVGNKDLGEEGGEKKNGKP